MELAIPIVALGSLYWATNQSRRENFQNSRPLPNTDVPNRNFPDEYPIQNAETDITSHLSVNNAYDVPYAYTDKYFNPKFNDQIVSNSATQLGLQGSINADGTRSASKGKSSDYYSLTGDKVDSGYFKHNNMVPYFSGSSRGRLLDENANEGLLDSMQGTGSQMFKKQERAPLFKPSENTHHAHGMPSNTDFIQSRMNVGMKMSNVKPFEEERVAPGLNGHVGGGYNNALLERDSYMPKSVDELRVANNAKSSGLMMLGHEGPANSRVKNMGFSGKVEKNRPERTFDYTPDRYMTTTGAIKAQTLHSIPIDRHVTREGTSSSYTGIATGQNPATYVEGEYMPSTRIELGELPMGGASAVGRQNVYDGDYEMRAKYAYPNNRSVGQQESYFGTIGGAFGAAVAPLLDILRPSRKENAVGTLRPYQNVKSEVANSYLFDPTEKLPTTIRETTELSKGHLNVNAGQRGGAYEVTPHQVSETNRHELGIHNYMGAVSATDGQRQIRPYDAEYNSQRHNDKKSSTIQGYMVQGNMNLFNGDVNARQKHLDEDLQNNRAAVPFFPSTTPDVAHLGKTNSATHQLYSNLNLDRSNPDILSQLKSNPYTHSVVNALR